MKSGSRKVTAISMANITAPIIVPEKKTMSRKRETSTAGTGALSSRITSMTSETTAKSMITLISPDSNQSFRFPSSSTYCSEPRPTMSRAMPAQSMFLR